VVIFKPLNISLKQMKLPHYTLSETTKNILYPKTSDISVLDDLYWRIKDDYPQMFIDGNIIPLSQQVVNSLNFPVNHTVPLRLYFETGPNEYEIREYKGILTGIEILGDINTYWNEIINYTKPNLKFLLDYLNSYHPTDYTKLKNKLRQMIRGEKGLNITRRELPIEKYTLVD
jgi:hypothetical protein